MILPSDLWTLPGHDDMAFETCLLKWNKHEWRYTLCIDILARSLYSSLALRIFKKDLTLAMAP
jgi:hypothetical protein